MNHHTKTIPLTIVAILFIAAFMIAATTAILLVTANDAFAYRYHQRHYHHHYHNHHYYYLHKKPDSTGNSGHTNSVNIQPPRASTIVNAGGNSAVQAVDNSAQCSIGAGTGIGGTITCLQVPLNSQTQTDAARSITSGKQVVNQNAECNVESISNPSCFASPRSLQIILS